MATHSKGDNATATISMDKETFEEARARQMLHKRKWRTFSAYVRDLIEADLAENPPPPAANSVQTQSPTHPLAREVVEDAISRVRRGKKKPAAVR